ncbi:hypothetical protein LAWI1_G008771 [Lachnellula willkommii]|uniref:2EXR domain-containing protein n=1 Tax=Lachnellula willkommii TaxID=215461 RepID=A0A559M8P4_9HELO|nr:hypothetical protein LAWI1_G008771 [Lachnellula willkommii]
MGPEQTTTELSIPISNGSAVTNKIIYRDEIATDFPQFNELPLELRLKIWGHAAPDPTTVVQRMCNKRSLGRFTYRRKPPAILHACQESRAEYLDTGAESGQASVARRRQEHPVYKLFFGSGPRCSTPAYFSVDIDAFWGGNYPARLTLPDGDIWDGIENLEIRKTLRHFVIKTGADTWRPNVGELCRHMFPELETITILVSPPYYTGDAPPEVGGQMNVAGMDDSQAFLAADCASFRDYIQDELDLERTSNPEWNPPVLKLRFEEQFLANSSISP